MRDQLFMSAEATDSGRLVIQKAWEVFADKAYSPRWPGGYPFDGFIVVRTLGGEGEITLKSGEKLRCEASSVARVEAASVQAYACVKPLWRFWWLECGGESFCALKPDSSTRVEQEPGEERLLSESLRHLAAGGAEAALGAAQLATLTRGWELRAGKPAADGPREGRLDKVMDRMKKSLAKPLKIGRLAKEAGLSESRFRQLFEERFGMAPKACYEHLRLAKGMELLRNDAMKLDEIASLLGYSSAFHFSKAFKSRHGLPPSEFRPRPSGAGARR